MPNANYEFCKKTFFITLLFLVISVNFTQSNTSRISDRNSLTGYDRMFANKNILLNQNASNEELESAIEDIASKTFGLNADDDILTLLDDLIASKSLDASIRNRAQLSRARIILRSKNVGDGKRLFEELIAKKVPNGLLEFSQSYLDLDQIDECALLCYERKPEYQFYRKGRVDLYTFSSVLLTKDKNREKNFSAIDDVGARLTEYDKDPNWKQVALALCYAADSQFKDSLNKLNQIQENLENKTVHDAGTSYNLYQDMPLYFSWVYMLENKDIDASIQNLREYVDRNETSFYVFNRLMQFSRDVLEKMDRHNLQPITSLIRNYYLKKEGALEGLPVDGIPGLAHLEDLYAMGLMFNNEIEEAKSIYESLYEKYFPNNIASISAAWQLANIELVYFKEKEKSKLIAERIINESSDSHFILQAQSLLKNADLILKSVGQ